MSRHNQKTRLRRSENGAVESEGRSVMTSKLTIARVLAIGAAILMLRGPAAAAEPFTLTSTTFKDGAIMPKKVANSNPANANCVGENVSPQFTWANPPEGTKSFALTMVDPEGRGGVGVYHWLGYGIPLDVTSLAEGEISKPSDKYIGGKSTQGVSTYSGPCTPPGSPHHYTFVIIATDLDARELPPGLTMPELWARLAGHTKGAAGMVGMFINPYPQ
jgi:Raf kinase inhibitor-like YbhB/YbcL family protein